MQATSVQFPDAACWWNSTCKPDDRYADSVRESVLAGLKIQNQSKPQHTLLEFIADAIWLSTQLYGLRALVFEGRDQHAVIF
jgi:hypothetical protein